MEKLKEIFMRLKQRGEVSIIVFGLIIIACTLVGVGTIVITGKKDTPLEQMAEHMLETHTGIDVDFSPEED